MPLRFQAHPPHLSSLLRSAIFLWRSEFGASIWAAGVFLLCPDRAIAGREAVAINQPVQITSLWAAVVDFAGGPVAAGLLVAAVLLGGVLTVLAFRSWRRRKAWRQNLRAGDTRPVGAEKVSTTAGQVSRSGNPVADDLTVQQQIQLFFFNLFKLQSGLAKDAPGQMYKVETLERCPENVYLMRLKQGGDWLVRRMSIGLLSSGAGSRSQCYYVIYDTHMVVKVPPQPIDDFYRYNRQLAREARIASQLAPLPCIVPKVSVILRKVHSLPYVEEAETDEIERRYKNLVETRPEYQEYLKIGSSFVFFMELSKHFFLSRTLDDIHSNRHSIEEEIRAHGELVWDQRGFTGRYGEDAWYVGVRIANIFNEIEGKLRKWCAERHVADVCSQYQLRRWFVDCLSRYDHSGDQENTNSETLDSQAIAYIGQLLTGHDDDVLAFRAMVEGSLTTRRYEMTRIWRRNLSSAMLDLLGSLGDKNVAMRDLKPENLFVAGEPSRYPNFLNDIKSFSIGLIDMETAVVMDNGSKKRSLDQPQLGGTPLYATPSHFLPNKALDTLFKDTRRTLHFQDWYAVVAIIFKIITGKSLFRKTAGLFPDILRQLRSKKDLREKLRDVVQQSALFWGSAAQEFETGMAGYLNVFEGIEIKVPRIMLAEIEPAMEKRASKLADRINNLLERQAIFKHASQKHQIQAASAAQIERSKMKLASRMEAEPQQSKILAPALKFLEQVRLLKFRMEQQQAAADALQAGSLEVSAVAVLEAMFYTVMNFMYPENWRRSVVSQVGTRQSGDKETTFLPTV